MTNPWANRPKPQTDIQIEEGPDMALEVTVTIKHGSGHGAPWTVIKGSPEEVADLLKVPNFDGRVSQIAIQANEVAAHVAKKFAELEPGKG